MALSDNLQSINVDSPIFAMVAGESSGDTLGADLVRSLKLRYPNARFVGIGGPKMLAEGFETWFPMESLSVMGFFEVIKHLPSLLKIRKNLITKLIALNPNVFIGIDAPDFNFKVESVLKSNSIKTIHYVGPSVWAWREKRLAKIKLAVDGVLVLFPFEPSYYHRYGIPVKFVGHPIANQFPEKPNTPEAKKTLGFSVDASVTAILPGSRMSEIDKMSDVYIQAASKLSLIYPDMEFVVPCVHDKAMQRVKQSVDFYGKSLKIKLLLGQSREVLEACDQALVTSGTATLECALMKKPLVLAIAVHPISYWIMQRLATTQWIGLPNILANETLVTELIQQDATADKIALNMGRLVIDKKLRERQITAFRNQYQQLKQNASELAADAVEQWMKH
ncbi:lipid-A-disaccharide synthase [Thiomicrorhabdus sp. Milos-T2]|uniref:lipid-A-disaccharide synthase n=1 Tax=Thiomicrorhabdus sp. Milos-T2 TaxID=90814 RepID=UPI001F39E766|nr:lipid-A-disaccharide synthase [Thiomicrorhabdus sp. Milos-T2]